MVDLHVPRSAVPAESHRCLNVADRLATMAAAMAAAMADAIAVASPRRAERRWPFRGIFTPAAKSYSTTTFAELDADATRLARGFAAWGVPPGTRLVLLVRPGIEFVTLVFAMLRAKIVIVLIDPGMGRRNLVRCLSAVEPEGFVAVGPAQAARLLLRHKLPRAKWNVTVGRRWLWDGISLERLRAMGDSPLPAPCSVLPTYADDPAAIIFTSGSTGPPKGVLYTHRMFDAQVAEIQSMYGIEPGGVDLACFPLFALFNSAMGITTVFPDMDFSRPASADPRKLLAAANLWRVTQAFASPAVWRVLSDYCAQTGERIESLRQVFSCGASVEPDVLRKTLACVGEGAKMHTPYGATECLPVSSIEASEVLSETAPRTAEGAGVCVGRKFNSIDWRIIRISDKPIETIEDAEELPTGEIGELIVRGPQASPEYLTQFEHNAATKIIHLRAGASTTPNDAEVEGEREGNLWHRMGDVGYLDDECRFWYCGRKSQRVISKEGTLFTECVEAIANTHPAVRRSALVGVGPPGQQTPVLVVERKSGWLSGNWDCELMQHLRARVTIRSNGHLLVKRHLPVDVRHNAKINREQLAIWAAKRLLM
jgi:acyl-CoA synthetase (AMP-forming)/AMP-acid ligase II